MQMCRLCLSEGDMNVISICGGDIEHLPDKIKLCVDINVENDDSLPNGVCYDCVEKITNWWDFRQMCLKSNTILLQNLAQKYIEGSDTNVGQYDLSESLDTVFEKIEIAKDLQDYYNNAATVNVNVYICSICPMEFKNCFDYLDHQQTHDGNSVFSCDKCNEVFDNRSHLVEHDKKHRSPCPQCGKMVLKQSMRHHLIKHSDKYECKLCLARCNSRAALNQHNITVHTDIKNHICEMCGKQFSSQAAIRVHIQSHSDERHYRCKFCDYAGRTSSALYVHMSTHATNTCVCSFCSKTFKSNRNLNDHVRRVHSTLKRHVCNYCGKKFVDKYMLSIHTRSHTGIRPYHCKFCQKSFNRSDGLREHIAIHGQRIMHCCDHCKKKFTSRRGLLRHNCSNNVV